MDEEDDFIVEEDEAETERRLAFEADELQTLEKQIQLEGPELDELVRLRLHFFRLIIF